MNESVEALVTWLVDDCCGGITLDRVLLRLGDDVSALQSAIVAGQCELLNRWHDDSECQEITRQCGIDVEAIAAISVTVQQRFLWEVSARCSEYWQQKSAPSRALLEENT